MTTDAKSLSEHLGERMRAVRDLQGWRQDEVAAQARRFGLAWTRATVAAIETGKREVTAGEFLLLPHLLRYKVGLPDLFPDECLVRLGPVTVVDGDALRRSLCGQTGTLQTRKLEEWEVAADEAESLAEGRAAARLGVDPRHLALAARRRWGRSLTEERDGRTPSGVTSAGHITRALVEELRSDLIRAGLIG